MGDKLLLKLNIYGKPIANKYCEGKMKRTLKRGLKDLKSFKRKRLKKSIDKCLLCDNGPICQPVLNRLVMYKATVIYDFICQKAK